MRIEQARAVRIEDELARRGVKLRGRRGSLEGPCPVCGGTDRFGLSCKKQAFNCRQCGGKGGGSIDLVMFLDGCDFKTAVKSLAGEAPCRTIRKQRDPAVKKSKDNSALAAWLGSRREPITENCPAGLYLRETRGHGGPIPATLCYLPANGKHPPAMIAAFGFCDELEPGVIDPPSNVAAVHLTRLTPDGRKAPIDPVKIMVGAMSGLPIVLAPVNDGLGLAITEGIEDGLSVFAETGLGVWAAGSAGNMPKIAAAIPRYVECVTVFAHRDEAGFRGGKEAARLIAETGVEVHLRGRG